MTAIDDVAGDAGRLEAAVIALAEGIVIVDGDGELLVANPAAYELLGPGVGWLLGETHLRGWRITLADGRTPVRWSELPLRQALRGERPPELEVVVHARDRPTRQLGLLVTPLPSGGAVIRARDLTIDRRLAEQAREAEDRFRLTFDGAPVGMALVATKSDPGRLLQVNPVFCALTGRPLDTLLELTLAELVRDEDRSELDDLLSGRTATATAQLRFLAPDESETWVQLHASVVRGAGVQYAIVQAEDIGVRRRYEERLRYLADHDPLTGLFNRRRFQEELEAHRERCLRYGADGALVLLDLDGFKDVNDTLGHAAGDAVLRSVAVTLTDRLRATDVVARLGGDEFAVLLSNAAEAESLQVGRDLVDQIAANVVTVSPLLPARVTATAGITLFAGPDLKTRDVLAEADVALYEAKDGERGSVTLFAPRGQTQRIFQRMTWSERIREALADDGFVLHCQPIMDFAAGRVTRHELLLRMDDGSGQLIAPGRFLPVAEQTGAIRAIDRWVLAHAVELLRDRRTAGDLLVNLSAASLTDPRLVEEVDQLVTEAKIDPARLTLEITETAAIAHIEQARMLAAQLRAVGCGLALDDFGAGFASFYYLKHVPVDVIKIDGEFVRDIATDPTSQAVVRALVETAAVIGTDTIAECVESAAALEFLRSLGVGSVQGYHVGRPAALDTLV